MKIIKIFSLTLLFGFLILIYENLIAFEEGIVGFTKKNGNETGCVCHGFDPNDTVSVVISGPSTVRANDTATFVLSITKGPAVAGGCDISTSLGNVYPSYIDTILRRAEPISGAGYELTHKEPKLFSNDTVKFTFKYQAPPTPNVTDTIFANGNSVNHDTTSDNDKWNYANNFLITILPTIGINDNESIAGSYLLEQNYPNPFNPETNIRFSIQRQSEITLSVFDINGKEVARLIDNMRYNAGDYSVALKASEFNLTSGVYFYKLTSGNFSGTRKMVLLK